MKGDVATPTRLVDITRLPLADVAARPDGGMRIGALVRNSDLANHPLVRERYPLLAQALLSGASPQLRNMATVGGNLLQRTRCHYFHDTGFAACNKRAPGSGCAARDGYNRIHADPRRQRRVHRDASVRHERRAGGARAEVVRAGRERRARACRSPTSTACPATRPSATPCSQPGELIIAVDLPASPFAAHSHYLKVRDRASYAFALVSVAAALDLQRRRRPRRALALGGVAHDRGASRRPRRR